jgi:hypothetical protein
MIKRPGMLGPTGDPANFKRLLDEQNDWPARFTFKFIVPKEQIDALRGILDGHELQTRASRKGNYLAVTLSPIMESADEILRIYGRAATIDGIVSL